VPEVIEDGVSGFIVEDEAEAIRAVQRLPELDRRQVRASFERRFTSSEMASRYTGCYKKILAEVRPDRTTHIGVTVGEVMDARHGGHTRGHVPTPAPTQVVNDESHAIARGANTREATKRPRPGGYAEGLRKIR
jgi:hypothetical protein